MKKEQIKDVLFILIGSIILMSAAFFNGFPIVYSDTSTYIASGLELETPFDRPITYGIFLRVFSINGWSLWSVIFFQSLIVSYLIFRITKLVFKNKKLNLIGGLITIVFLSLFSGLSWTVSQLMPDIFTSTALLSLLLILYERDEKKELFLIYVIFFLSVAMHMSHLLLYIILLFLILIFKKKLFHKEDYRSIYFSVGVLLILTIASILTMGSAMSKSKHVFFMGTMVEHGILKQYLDDNCSKKEYKLCAYKDSLPQRAYQFVWDEDSPFYKIGGWKETKQEFNEIIYSSLTEKKYIGMHIKESLKATYKQLLLFDIGDGNGSFLEGTLLYERIAKYFNNNLLSYSSSKQSQKELGFVGKWNVLFSIVVILSVLFLIFAILVFRNKINNRIKNVLFLFSVTIAINAWDCGTFANAIDRLGCKMIWLIPFVAILIAFNLKQNLTKS